ncbi:ras-related C3 botulinum toxin substrate 1 precursor [Auriculariales sp. MPI-PUGE-AT-0066]|nr:ras-related C3 botulinum toxin substrate 1 precursor [Auriculariales sp. MPI-PUGE-AT-0066]
MIECSVVGDGGVGKTSLVLTYKINAFPTGYIPTVLESYTTFCALDDGVTHDLSLWDTSGQQSYYRLRILTYAEADVVLLCFDISSTASFDNIRAVWMEEIQHYCPGLPVVVAGLKTDLRWRRLNERYEQMEPESATIISYQQGRSLAAEIGAVEYVECSASTQEGVKNVFAEVVRVALNHPKPEKRKRKCAIL